VRYVGSKNQKAFMKDLKLVYQALNEDAALDALDELEKRWGDKYPVAISSWRNKWSNLSNYFKYIPKISGELFIRRI
jgi:transposase-like protein